MEEEISLKEILMIIWNGKLLVSITTAVALIAATIYSFIIVNPVYEGRTVVGFNSISTVPENVQPLINELTTVESFENLINSPEVISATTEKLETEQTYSGLRNQISFNRLNEGESYLEITFTSENSNMIGAALEELVLQTNHYMGVMIQDRLTLLANEYQTQMKLEENNIQDAITAFNVLDAHNQLPTLMLVNKNTSGNQLILDVNEMYLEEFKNLDKGLQSEYEKITDKIDNHTSLFNFYSRKLEEVESVKDMNIIDVRIDTITQPFVKSTPISPNKTLNITIAAILGLMLGVFIVFMKHYLKEDR